MAQARSRRRHIRARRTPTWAVVCAVVGAFLLLASSGLLAAGQWLLARYELDQEDLLGDAGETYGEDIDGPLNILLVGVDTRPSRPEEAPRADSIMVVHVDEDLQRGYLISFPRDLLVDIPPDPETGFAGGQDRLNAAMYYGSRQLPGEELPDLSRGFALLARTVGNLTGIETWDAGVVIDFEGFVGVVDALGGVTMELDERIVSEHRQPDGRHRPPAPGGEGYVGPQATYEPGVHHLKGWQALDIARQRYSVTGGDYGRQRNQQRLLEAIVAKALSREILTDPVRLDRVVRSAGDSLVFDGRGRGPIDFAFALRGLRPGDLTMMGVPAGSVVTDDGYQGEALDPTGAELFRALSGDTLPAFLARHPDLAR